MFDSVRTRLTLWYAGVLALSLIAFAFLVYYGAARAFYQQEDESLLSTAQTVASAYVQELEEEQSVDKANEVVLAEMVFPNRYVEVIQSSGEVVAWSKNLSASRLIIPIQTLNNARQQSNTLTTVARLRVAIAPLSPNSDLGFAAVAEPISVINEGLSRLRNYFFAGVPAVLIFATLGGYFLANKSLSPIASMNRQTREITAQQLSKRLDVKNSRDEPGTLAITINDLLSRLETSFKAQQRFIADASHELRTPLAVLRGETEVALTKPRTTHEYQVSLALIKDEAERLSRIVEDLFILARQPLDTPTAILKEPVLLNNVVLDCARAARVLAIQKHLRLQTDGDSKALMVCGDDELLKRMLLNLLDNATKYTPEGGQIRVEVQQQNGSARIVVSDTGIGIPEADQARIFDRFYRVDKARSRAQGGAGLGLSIARWIVEAHGGSITIDSAPGRGSAFSVELPLQRNVSL